MKDKYAHLRSEHIDLLINGHSGDLTREQAQILLLQKQDPIQNTYSVFKIPKKSKKKKYQQPKPQLQKKILNKLQNCEIGSRISDAISQISEENFEFIEQQCHKKIDFNIKKIRNVGSQTIELQQQIQKENYTQNFSFAQKLKAQLIQSKGTQVRCNIIDFSTQYDILESYSNRLSIEPTVRVKINNLNTQTEQKFKYETNYLINCPKDNSINKIRQERHSEQYESKNIKLLKPDTYQTFQKHSKKNLQKIQLKNSNKKIQKRSITTTKNKNNKNNDNSKIKKENNQGRINLYNTNRIKTDIMDYNSSQDNIKNAHTKILSIYPTQKNQFQESHKLKSQKNNMLKYIVNTNRNLWGNKKSKPTKIRFNELFNKLQNRRKSNLIYINETINQILDQNNNNQYKFGNIQQGQDINLYLINTQFRQKINIIKQRKSMGLVNIKYVLKKIAQIYKNSYTMIKKQYYSINFIQLLIKQIQRQFGKLKKQQIYQKCHSILQGGILYSRNNYFIKNFMLLTTLLKNYQYNNIIFSSDIIFYLDLLEKLNCGYKQQFNYQYSFTTIQKLQDIINNFIKVYYPFPQLYQSINQSINNLLHPNLNIDTKLDIFKCCQLILQQIFKIKYSINKSYNKLIYAIKDNNNLLINQDQFKNILELLIITKLDHLKLINRFRMACGKISIPSQNLASFCLRQTIPQFQKIPLINSYLLHYKIINIQYGGKVHQQLLNYHSYHNLGKISDYLLKNKDQNLMPSNHALTLVQFQILQKQSSLLMQKILGYNLIQIYASSIYLLQNN